jgi:hypothetical protein
VTRAGQQLLSFFLAFGALALVAAVLLPRVLGLAAGPEAEIVSLIKSAERKDTELRVPWLGEEPEGPSSRPLRPLTRRYDRITVVVAPDSSHAMATGTLDFEGELGALASADITRVSSLGFEEIPFTLNEGEWKPELGLAPRLSAVVAALESRREALEDGNPKSVDRLREATVSHPDDSAALARISGVAQRRYRAVAWYIRGERGEVQVTERYRLTGTHPGAPVDEQGMVQLRLRPRGREFFFVSALM